MMGAGVSCATAEKERGRRTRHFHFMAITLH
jgi:hypothetical protein